jgi:hypothetical protein
VNVKFSKTYINSINDLLMMKRTGKTIKKVDVPSEESFTYILKKALTGNEMAAIQLNEWLRYCNPADANEQELLDRIKKAADKIFIE